ncbi:MAG TPA: hypothetical protein VGI92_14610 [Gemmatimonadales bacterium]|jgi:uncharacterized membrane protein
MSLALLQQTVTTQPHGQLESSMFWVGVLIAFLPVGIIGGILGYVWWSRRRQAEKPTK